MRDDIDFDRKRHRHPLISAFGSSVVRLALLFSTVGIALAMFLAPETDRNLRPIIARATLPADLDMTATGSTSLGATYTVRRSVLQPSPDAICVIRADGSRVGAC